MYFSDDAPKWYFRHGWWSIPLVLTVIGAVAGVLVYFS
jgi:hypothetical protein